MGRKQLSMFEFKIKRKVFLSNLKMSPLITAIMSK